MCVCVFFCFLIRYGTLTQQGLLHITMPALPAVEMPKNLSPFIVSW